MAERKEKKITPAGSTSFVAQEDSKGGEKKDAQNTSPFPVSDNDDKEDAGRDGRKGTCGTGGSVVLVPQRKSSESPWKCTGCTHENTAGLAYCQLCLPPAPTSAGSLQVDNESHPSERKSGVGDKNVAIKVSPADYLCTRQNSGVLLVDP